MRKDNIIAVVPVPVPDVAVVFEIDTLYVVVVQTDIARVAQVQVIESGKWRPTSICI